MTAVGSYAERLCGCELDCIESYNNGEKGEVVFKKNSVALVREETVPTE
jgi:hypothetical protein